MTRTKVIILGAGPAGLGAAWQLAKQQRAHVTVLEQRDDVGGNAGSFDLQGLSVDFGSHRLHPSCQPRILDDLRELLGPDLLDRPRHGRIRLGGKWIHFPLKATDLLLNLPWPFRIGVAWDTFRGILPRAKTTADPTFASILQQGLGATICREFYFPYAVKIWGQPPQELSAVQAQRRVSASSLMKMIRKIFGLKVDTATAGKGRFFYPRGGFGQISRAIADAARQAGADIHLSATARKIQLGSPHRVEVEHDGTTTTLEADYLWSTIPISVLPRLITDDVPQAVIDASKNNLSRAMVLIYLVLDQDQFTPFDAHYFPGADIRITRLSEPKNYSDHSDPVGRTILCAELPCNVGDELWQASDDTLGQLVKDALAQCGLPISAPVSHVTTKRLPQAYPIYLNGYEKHFHVLDDWASGLKNVLSFGRQGLFAHDNTHHALAMAYAAAECLHQDGSFDADQWRRHRDEFESHVVED